MKQKVLLHQPHSFKRYCEYEIFQSLGNSKVFQQQSQQIQTQVIMFPPPRETRSKTAFASRGLAFQNIGENLQSKPRLGQRNAYSRQNIQIMNKKLKKLKESMFGSCHLDSTSPDVLKNSQMKLNGCTKIFAHSTLPLNTKRKIYSCSQLRSHYNPQSPKTDEKQQFLPKPKTSQNPRNMKKAIVEQKKLEIKPHSFKATLKQKHIDDNPKVLANIIRKKVQCMNNLQIHEYIHSLMRKPQS